MKTITRLFALLLTCFIFSVAAHASDLWMTDYSEALKKASQEKKQILLDFTGSDWCPHCISLKKDIFDKPEFQKYAAKNLILVSVDFPRDNKQSEALQKKNDDLQKQYKVNGYPTLILINAQEKLVGQHLGGFDTPTAFIEWAGSKAKK